LVKFFSVRGGAEAHLDLRRMMTDRYLTTVLEEAEHVAEQYDPLERQTTKPTSISDTPSSGSSKSRRATSRRTGRRSMA